MTTFGSPAIFSPDRLYRYVLRRIVGMGEGICLFVMLNPSTANEFINDPSIRRCVGFARLWGYGVLEVVNLFAYCTFSPKILREVADPVGAENDAWILDRASKADLTVVAWGNNGGYLDRGREVEVLLSTYELYCFGLTNIKEPRHPLYIRRSQPLERSERKW